MTATVLTIGTFDPVHVGHVNLFKQAASFGDLTIGVNSDEFIKRYRGTPPLFTLSERTSMIQSLELPATLRENHSAGRALILDVRPDIIVVGSDWADRDYLNQIDMSRSDLEARRITLVFVPRVGGFSAGEIKRRARL